MRKLLACGILVALLLAVGADCASAQFKNFKTVKRSWKETGSGPISTVLAVMIPILESDADGNPVTTIETRFINVAIYLDTPAPLRKGEIETFKLAGAATGNPQSPDLLIAIESDRVYHHYGQAVDTIGSSAGSAELHLTHTGRIPSTPPAAFNNVVVDFTTPAEPFKFKFFDFALVDNMEATSSYEFVIKRSRWFGSDKLVAKGEIAQPEHGGLSAVEITEGCPFTDGADEYFQSGRKYYILLRVKRSESQFYTDEFSEEMKFPFVFKDSYVGDLDPDLASTNKGQGQQKTFNRLHKD